MKLKAGETDWLNDPPRTQVAPVKARARVRRPAALIKADAALSFQQRAYRDLIANTKCIADANREYDKLGFGTSRAVMAGWRKKPKFAKALELFYEFIQSIHGLSKASLVHRAEQIRDQALTPQPILYKGGDTGFEEVQLGTALKAVELQGKLLGVFKDEVPNVAVALKIDFGAYGDEPIEGEVVE